MEQIMCMVSKDAKNVLLDHQRGGGFKRQRDALEDLLIEFGSEHEEWKIAFMEKGAIVMIESLKVDGIVPIGINSSDAAEEAILRHQDPMSDPKPINKIIEGDSGD